jgi:predicted histone-like DNA-binding protein
MSIRLHKVVKKNPQDLSQVKYYLTQLKKGTIGLDEVAKQIAADENMSEGNVYSALIGLTRHLSRYIRNGDTVRLGNFGSFHLSVQSDGKDTPEELTTHDVKHTKVVFLPGVELKQSLEHLSFEIDASHVVAADEPEAATEG